MAIMWFFLLLFIVAYHGSALANTWDIEKRPNIVLILSDDQDLVLGSTDYQAILHREIFAKGTQFVNHYATTANCCPSRASLFRGQHAHNTNITHVNAPGSGLMTKN